STLLFFLQTHGHHRDLPSFPTRRSSDLARPLSATIRITPTISNGTPMQRKGTKTTPTIVKTRPITSSRALVETSANRSLRPRFQDRKSTRLNSSHVSISYAVFCLKKKKK